MIQQDKLLQSDPSQPKPMWYRKGRLQRAIDGGDDAVNQLIDEALLEQEGMLGKSARIRSISTTKLAKSGRRQEDLEQPLTQKQKR